jgi:hypothetical protein
MSRFSATVLMLAAFVLGCAASSPDSIGCRSDSECGDTQVCFPEGCGDPGRNIVVEVVPNPKGGLYAQDFRVDDLRSEHNLKLFDPSTLQGQVRVETESSSSASYTAPVTLRMTGESLLIPGVVRRHETTFTPEDGGYSLPVGVGNYSITLIATNTELPPLFDSRVVWPGRAETLDFLLPASTALLRLSGKVVRHDGLPMDVDLEIQALDETLRPLSQRVPVTRATGEFSLALPPSAAWLSNVNLQVLPTAADALVPQKLFNVDPRESLPASLSMGDYGAPVKVSGRVWGPDQKPVPQATVYLQGKVGGGGEYRSRKVLTDEGGFFELLSLPSSGDSAMKLYIVPPPGSLAGLTLKPVSVARASTVALADVTCAERVKVRGTLLMPNDSLPAVGAKVEAEPTGEVLGWPRPALRAEALRTTDESGRFELWLDPGQYRFDFLPTEGLPRVSRIVSVLPGDMELSPFTLSKGRRITGLVSISGAKLTEPAVPYASVRFFRVVHVEGKPSALLLSQTLTDQSGNYSTTVPAR